MRVFVSWLKVPNSMLRIAPLVPAVSASEPTPVAVANESVPVSV